MLLLLLLLEEKGLKEDMEDEEIDVVHIDDEADKEKDGSNKMTLRPHLEVRNHQIRGKSPILLWVGCGFIRLL